MKVIRQPFLPLFGYKAMTIGPWIFTHRNTVLSETDIRHEGIHWEQEKELLIVGFYLLWVLFFLWEFVRCLCNEQRSSDPVRPWKNGVCRRADRSIPFQKEAYRNEDGQFYIEHRRHYAWARKDSQ